MRQSGGAHAFRIPPEKFPRKRARLIGKGRTLLRVPARVCRLHVMDRENKGNLLAFDRLRLHLEQPFPQFDLLGQLRARLRTWNSERPE